MVTGLFAAAVAYGVQAWAQTRLSASRTSLLLTTEPVFAGLVGVLVAGEQLGSRQLLGAALVTAAMLLTLRRARRRAHPPSSSCTCRAAGWRGAGERCLCSRRSGLGEQGEQLLPHG